MKEILTVEEILALWKKRPNIREMIEDFSYIDKHDLRKRVDEIINKNDEWIKVFVPKLEAFLEDHVSRAQIQKLIEKFPRPYDFYGDGKRFFYAANDVDEWKKRLEAVLEK